MSQTDDQLDAFAVWERQEWETRAASYAERITDLTRGAADALLDAVEVTAHSALLDVATGPGVVATAARTRGAEVIGVDQSEAMVALARSAGLHVCQARAEQLPFESGAFDAVIASFLINHLSRPVDALVEFARVCRGRVAVSVWDAPDANPALGLFSRVVQSLDISDPAPPGPDSSLYADAARMSALLVAGGLFDIRLTRVRWALTVAPGAWFDAVAAGTPRTGAVLAAASTKERAVLRKHYVEAATASYASPDGRVTLPAAALLGSGRSRTGRTAVGAGRVS